MKQLDHERCSESLSAYLDGSLDAEERGAVEGHLQGCTSCTAELEALQSLLAQEVEPLSADESGRLRTAVRAAIDSRPTEVTTSAATVIPARRAWRYRGAQLLGAAALIILGVVFVRSLDLGGVGPQGAAVGGGGSTGESAEISTELDFQGVPSPGQDPFQSESIGATSGGGGAGGSIADAEGEPQEKALQYAKVPRRARSDAPRPLYVRGAGRISDRKLTLIGRYGLPLVLFPRAYRAIDAVDLQQQFLQQLANAAETEARAEQIMECGSSVLARPDPALPALATFGRFQDRPTLVLAFAWTDAPDGRLDRFMVWAWPKGNCEAVPNYRAGSIKV